MLVSHKKIKPSSLFLPLVLPSLILLSGLGVTYQVWNLAVTDAQRELQHEFDSRAKAIETQIIARFKVYSQLLHSAKGLFSASHLVERSEFKTFFSTLELQKFYPGIQGIGFSLIIPPTEKQKHIATIRGEGFSDYTIRPSGKRDIYTSIVYLEPFEGRNLRAFGYDMYSESIRRDAMNQARDIDEPAVSKKVRLEQETNQDEQAGFLMYLPVYRNGTEVKAPAERRANLIGWVYSPFRAQDFIRGILTDFSEIDIEVYDGKEQLSSSALFLTHPKNIANHFPLFKTLKRIAVNGHYWTINVHSTPKFEVRLNLERSYFIIGTGVSSSLMLSLIFWLLVNGRASALHLAEKMNQAFEKSEERFKTLFNQAPIGIALIDSLTGHIYNANEKYAQIVGLTVAELQTIDWMKITHPDDIQADLDNMALMNSGKTNGFTMEKRYIHKNGSIVWVNLTVAKMQLKEHNNPCHHCIVEDITEWKQAEQQLSILSVAIEQAPVSVAITDLDATLLYINPQFTKVTGYSFEEAIGQNPRILHSGLTSDEVYQQLWDNLTQGRAWHGDLINKRKNAELYWEAAHIAPVKDISGVVTHYVGIKIDITERKQIEQKLVNSESRLRMILESEPECIKIIDSAGRLQLMNRAGLQMIEADSFAQVQGKPVLPLIAPEYQKGYAELMERVIAGEKMQMEYEIIGLKGGRCWLETHAVPMQESDSSIVHLAVTRDISERKQIEEALRQAKQAAEQANHAKSEFLANMSHEIRTPMNAILGFSDILSDLVTDSTHRYYLDAIHRSGKTLLQLINDILDLSKIEAGKFEVVYQSVIIRNIFNDIRLIFSQKIAEKNIKFTLSFNEQIPQHLWLDEIRLRQIMLNLMGNAIKFTHQGFIRLNVTCKPSSDLSGFIDLIIEIEDSGIGIPAEQIEIIFSAFTQQKNQSIQYGGTGLGLTICKRLIEMMGGTISVRSQIGMGSCFRIELPRVEICNSAEISSIEAKRLTAQAIHFQPANLLLVDDIESNRLLIKTYLHDYAELQIVEAVNGKQALELIAKHPFDLIFMDKHLPYMDGDSVCERIRAEPNYTNVPIIMVTATALVLSEQQRPPAYNLRLTKPVSKAELLNAMQTLLPLNESVEINLQEPTVSAVEEIAVVENLPELIELLRSHYQERIAMLHNSGAFEIDVMIEIADELLEIAEQYHCQLLENWATTLRKEAELFDLENLPKTLSGFNVVIANLK
jgi:nitrogen fixation negative regulator NifL